jgi:hypothetical protein
MGTSTDRSGGASAIIPRYLSEETDRHDQARRSGSTMLSRELRLHDGGHGMAGVDDESRVHGLEGLRVSDASVMPAVASTNTNTPTIMIAEKGRRSSKAPRGKEWRRSEGLPRAARSAPRPR